ncbi:MAG: ABC transporter substrate-binding protein, partial [Chloroflexota bacterium]
MRKASFITTLIFLALALVLGCSQPAAEPTKAPAATPAAQTKAPAAEPTKEAEPTKAEAPASGGVSGLAVVRASHQPCLHALPTILGMKKGWFEKEGIQIDFKYFAAGAPQVEAGAAGGWDVGAMGTPPTIVGGLSYGQLMIGVSNDESITNALVVRPEAFDTWLKDPKTGVKGKTVLCSTISTGHFVLTKYLASLGLTDNDVKIVHMDQAGILTAFTSGQGDIAQVWAPFGYMHEEKGLKVLVGG